jgi:Domain of unknown function (DUF5127)
MVWFIRSWGTYSRTFITLPSTLQSIAITPTQTVVSARAGPMQVNPTFLNPIEVRFHYSVTFQCPHTHHIKPRDRVKQSIPFSYSAFTANSLDGASHALQVYSDVSGGTCSRSSLHLSWVTEWSSGDRSQTLLWSSTSNADVIFHRATLQTPALFTEVKDQTDWGTLYYAMKAVRDNFQFTFLPEPVMVYAGGK